MDGHASKKVGSLVADRYGICGRNQNRIVIISFFVVPIFGVGSIGPIDDTIYLEGIYVLMVWMFPNSFYVPFHNRSLYTSVKEAVGIERTTIDLVFVQVRVTRTSRGHRCGPQILEVIWSFSVILKEPIGEDCIIIISIGRGVSHHIDGKEVVAACVIRSRLDRKRHRLVAPHHDVGTTPNRDEKDVEGTGIIGNVNPILGQEIHFTSTFSILVQFHIQAVPVPPAKDHPPSLPLSGRHRKRWSVLSIDQQKLVVVDIGVQLKEPVPALEGGAINSRFFEMLHHQDNFFGGGHLLGNLSGTVLHDEYHSGSSAYLKSSRAVSVGVNPVSSSHVVTRKQDFVPEGFSRFDAERGVIGGTLAADVCPVKVEVGGIRMGIGSRSNARSVLRYQIVFKIDVQSISLVDAQGRTRETPSEQPGVEGRRSFGIVLSFGKG